MPTDSYLLAAIGCSALITLALRALPFGIVGPLRDSALMRYLAERLPVGLMLILVVYSMHGTLGDPLQGLLAVLSLAVTIAVHLWRHNALLSILAGTISFTVGASLTAA